MLNPLFQRRLTSLFLFCAACGVGAYLVNWFSEFGPYRFGLFVGMLALVVWLIWAGPRWWLPMPVAVTFGGIFFVGFKIYLYEMALPFCMLALFLALLLRRSGRVSQREPIPLVVWALFVYLLAEWLVSLLVLNVQGLGGGGSLTRVYVRGLWPLLFFLMFYYFGDSRFLRTALVLMYVACLLRIMAATFTFFVADLVFIPILDFAFSSTTNGVVDFRFSGIQLLFLGLCFAHISRVKLYKVLHWTVALVAAGIVLLGGGRVSVGMLFTIPIIWALLFRRIGVLSVLSGLMLGVVLFLNQQPQVIYLFPQTAQRALSILIRDSPESGVDWHQDLRASNDWHKRLSELGRERWLESPVTVLFGERAEPFDENFEAYGASIETRAQVAARMGLYESGLWTVLGLMGVCGVLIYCKVFWYLLKDVGRSLWREGMSTSAHVIGFMAIASTVLWVLFAWIAGGFPSQELLMAMLTRYAWEDGVLKTKEPPLPAPVISEPRSPRVLP